MIKRILIPFVVGFAQPNNAETRSRLNKMLQYLSDNPEEDFLILLSGGGSNKTLARELLVILRNMGCENKPLNLHNSVNMDCNLPDDKFIYEENSWDTTTQVQEMIPIIKKYSPLPEVIVFTNNQHLARIDLIFRRYGIKIKKLASPLSFKYRIFYRLIYEPLMWFATILRLDILITRFTKKRLKTIIQ